MAFSPLPDYATLELTGADRLSFLQGQLTQDVGALEPSAVATAALLNPAGRVLAVATVIAREESALLVVPADIAASLAQRLRRYVLRAKVRIAAGTFALAGRASATGARGHERLTDGASVVGLGTRELLIAPAAVLASHLAPDDGAGAQAWELGGVLAGEPSVVAATAELWTAQMLNLDLVRAISFTKGCYTGQEIVARTQHLGRIKRRTFRYRSEESVGLARGEALFLDGAKVGEVLRSSRDGAATELLAVVGLEARERPLESERGARFAPRPLPYAVP